jgi:AcrR family transcriptional regulator
MPDLFPASLAPKPAAADAPHDARRWTRRKGERPAELLAAALALFVERGYANTRLEDVAARAGVSKGTLYLYYANKEDLFKAVVRTGLVSPLLEAREVVAHFPGTAGELLGLVVHGWWARIGNTALSGIPKLIMAEARNFPEIARFYFEEVIQPGQATMAAVIQRGIDSGEFRPVNAMHAAHLLTAPFLLIGSWRTSMADAANTADPRFIDGPAVLELHLEMLKRGLAPGAAPGAGVPTARAPAASRGKVPIKPLRAAGAALQKPTPPARGAKAKAASTPAGRTRKQPGLKTSKGKK